MDIDTLNAIAREASASSQISGVAGKATIAGGIGTSAYTLLGGDLFLSIVGVAATAGTFLLNWFFKRKEHQLNARRLELEYKLKLQAEQRRQQETEARIMMMQSGLVPPQFPKTTQVGES